MSRTNPMSLARTRAHLVQVLCLVAALLALAGCKPATEDEAKTEKAETTATTEAEGTPATDEAKEKTADESGTPSADPAPADDKAGLSPPPDPTAAPAANLGGALDALAGVVPDDTLVLAVTDVAGLARAMTPGGNDAIRQSLRKDMGELFMRGLGLDPSKAERIAFAGGSRKWVAVFIEGEVVFDTTLQTEEIGGLKARVLKEDDILALDLDTYTVLLPRKVAEAFAGAQSAPKLKAAAHYAAIQKAIAAAGDEGVLLGAVYLDEKALAELDAELPPQITGLDAAALSAGKGLTVVATGSPDAIKALQGGYEALLGEVKGEIGEAYARRGEARLEEAFGAVLGHHVLQSLELAFAPTFEGEVARLHVGPEPLLESGSLAVLGAGMGFALFGVREKSAVEAMPAVATPVEAVPPAEAVEPPPPVTP